MTRRATYRLAAALLIAGAAVIVYMMWRGDSTQARLTGEQAAASAGSPGVLLNEILFQPEAGPSFVELVNAGQQPAPLDGYALANQAGARYEMPEGLTLPVGGVLLIRFDGAAQAEGTSVRAPQTDFLHAETGSLSLLSGSDVSDEVLWNTTGGPSFNLGRGGYIPAFVAGTTLGRPRGSTGRGPAAWTVFDPVDATPGAPNPFPAVTGMMPLSGAILRVSTPTLAWYGVPTAVSYRVQLATERSFASPVFDQTSAASGPGITTEQIAIPALSSGRYLWRVQAIFGDPADQSAAFSRPAIFWLEAGAAVAARAHSGNWTSAFVAAAFAAEPPAVRKILPVPLILQTKDTSLLSLEAEETGANRWDHPWPVGKAPYCARASIAMVTAYFGGNLSQDRISYAGNKDSVAGPQLDIDVTRGWLDSEIERALTFALGSAPRLDFAPSQVAAYVQQNRNLLAIYWTLHQAEIDAPRPRPIVASTANHAWVIVGYGEDTRGKYFTINDPAIGQYDWLLLPNEGIDDADLIPPPGGAVSTSFFLPPGARGRSDEPGIHRDSDGDGVMDFDETERFKTSPQAKDHDGDGVPDKQDIRAWVFDDTYGYLPYFPRDYSDQDLDGKRMELDNDSDGGGCKDGEEDKNANGKRDGGETSNFDKEDDECPAGPLGGRVKMTYAYAATRAASCIGRVEIHTRFTLIPVTIPDAPNLVLNYRADEMSYDIRTDGCPDAPGDRLIYDFSEGFQLSGTLPLSEENLGLVNFFPSWPKFSMQLPYELIDLNAANRLKGTYTTITGGGPWSAETSVVFEPLNILSDPTSCADPNNSQFARPDKMEFCTDPTPCSDQLSAPVECLTEPQRYYVIPFQKSFRWDAPGNEPGDRYHIDDADVIVEICEGCGDEFVN